MKTGSKEQNEVRDIKAGSEASAGTMTKAKEKIKSAKVADESVAAETKVSAGGAFLRIVLFTGLFLVLFFFANKFFMPEISRQNSYVKRRNFYDEPKNTI